MRALNFYPDDRMSGLKGGQWRRAASRYRATDLPVTVRHATPDDADAIERIRTDTWRATYRGLVPDALLDQLGYEGSRRRQDMAQLSADRFALVAEHDGAVVAFCYGGPSRVADPRYPGEIYAIYVEPEHQGHSHGSGLLREGAHELAARGWRGMLIWVLRENWPSRRFYQWMGGRHLRDEERELGGVTLSEAGYGWDDVGPLLTVRAQGRLAPRPAAPSG